MQKITATEALMIGLRLLGVMIACDLVAKVCALGITPGMGPNLALLASIGLDVIVAIAFFFFPDRIALKLSRRLDDRFAAYAVAFAGILIAVAYTSYLIQNVGIYLKTGHFGEEFARAMGVRSTPADLAIQAGGMACGILLLLFPKNIAEWTDLEWWRQKAWEDAQR